MRCWRGRAWSCSGLAWTCWLRVTRSTSSSWWWRGAWSCGELLSRMLLAVTLAFLSCSTVTRMSACMSCSELRRLHLTESRNAARRSLTVCCKRHHHYVHWRVYQTTAVYMAGPACTQYDWGGNYADPLGTSQPASVCTTHPQSLCFCNYFVTAYVACLQLPPGPVCEPVRLGRRLR